jgi:two-component system NtrC family sensor kinase
MKIGTRLAWVLLACVTPVLALYMDFSIRRSTDIYINALKREVHATVRALEAALEPDVATDDWISIRSALERIHRDQTEAAIYGLDGRLLFALPQFPLRPSRRALAKALSQGATEFVQSFAGRDWLCQVVPLMTKAGKPEAILVVGLDFTDVASDLDRRVFESVGAGLAVIAIIALIIPVASHYYVSRPLAELSRRVTRFSSLSKAEPDGDEVRLLSEEFRRLGQELDAARDRLLKEGERKLELERQLRHSDRLAAIGTLASGLAHEIGTPLNVIRGRAEYLMKGRSDPARVSAGLAVIVSQIDRISRIVRMLLDFGGRRERVTVVRDLRDIVHATHNLLETEADLAHVAFELDLGSTPLMVRCNPDQLQQVFVNLAVNAIDAMRGRGGRLRVSARAEPGGNQVSLVFDDNGPGIRAEHRERVFDPFFTTKEPGKGTGIGLTVSQAIIKEHGGSIEVQSGAGGSRFTVVLELAARQGHMMVEQA